MNKITEYRIEDTPCFPCRYKIVPVGNWTPSNASCDYFRTIAEARAEIDRRLSSHD